MNLAMRASLVFLFMSCLLLAACARMAPKPPAPSKGHINAERGVTRENIPKLVQHTPVLPEPKPPVAVEKYTVVVNEVPVKELLFALARDADVNVDIDPGIKGVVTLNAVNQTMNQILDRIARQVDLRYEYHDNVLTILPDMPYIHSYQVNYINQQRIMKGDVALNTSISTSGGGNGGGGAAGGGGNAGGGGGGGSAGGTGATSISIEAKNDFWKSLIASVKGILGEGATDNDVIAYPESGLLLVRATASKHKKIQELIDKAIQNARRQVLIQVTIAEVTLNDNYQAGIDWSIVNNKGTGTQLTSGVGTTIQDTTNAKAGVEAVSSALAGTPVSALSSFVLSYTDPNANRERIINATIKLLHEFGDVNILSTPQIMALNNQTAVLKVVDDIVYFKVDASTSQSQTNTVTTFDTTPKTVSVGVSMSVTPQINANDSIILNIRPSVSRVLRFVNDPNPQLTIPSGVPELRVREFETMLQVNSGQVAVLGGLMENNNQIDNAGTPGFSKIPLLGDLFKSRARQYRKTELVIFLRPQIIRNPSLEGDFKQYRTFLESKTDQSETKGGS
jgi:MSHA type pilus biogenesis protein MshL